MTRAGPPFAAKRIAVSHSEATVLIELICDDAYGAVVLYDDVLSRLSSEGGMNLFVRCNPAAPGTGAQND